MQLCGLRPSGGGGRRKQSQAPARAGRRARSDGWVSMGDGLVETTPGAREAHVRGSVGFNLSMFRDAGRGIGGQGTSRV